MHMKFGKKWINDGCNWKYSKINQPEDWDPKEQLKKINNKTGE